MNLAINFIVILLTRSRIGQSFRIHQKITSLVCTLFNTKPYDKQIFSVEKFTQTKKSNVIPQAYHSQCHNARVTTSAKIVHYC